MHRFAAMITALVTCATAVRAEPPHVVTDILPVGAIVARVMDGAGTPDVLVPPGTSPHDYAMRPSEARQLAHADLVVWTGPELTGFLEKPLQALASDAQQLTLTKAPLTFLSFREGVAFDGHDHEHGHSHDDDHGHEKAEGAIDPHLWLDPDNAGQIAQIVADTLVGLDAENAALYLGNAADFRGELAELRAEIDAMIAPVRSQPFLVLHDAFHYFEEAFGIEASAAVMLGDAVAPGPARLSALRQTLADNPVVCAFAEPQMDTSLIETALEGQGVRIATLDPIGDGDAPAATRYADMLRAVAVEIADCLAAG